MQESDFGKLTKIIQKDWADITEKDIRNLVSHLMVKHGDNGKETGYTAGLKIPIKSIVRFVNNLGKRIKKVSIVNEGDCIKVTPKTWIDKHIWREINDILRLHEFR